MSMRTWTGTLGAVLFAAAATLTAQNYPAAQSGSTMDQNKGQKVTVTGCIQRASETATGTAGTTTGAAENIKFVLTNVTAGTSGATDETAKAGTASSPTASTYRLDADDSKLSPHVGHKVEITGRVAKSASSVSPAEEPKETNPPTAGGTSMAQASAPKLQVDSVRMISTTCPQ